ncbi:thermonuclease family protein [Maioricimonas sp. JC845]|uniref:thermonuclease family protein n=1 Tax=Maioricimonas sp. JC845 TaxID=3232138 RepID=UPI003459DFB8
MYEYRARILRVIDGDTVEAELDLGFRIAARKTLRLAGLNASEVRGDERPRGMAAARWLRDEIERLTSGTGQLIVRTERDVTGKYGRVLATLIAATVNLNEALIEAGHAIPTGEE